MFFRGSRYATVGEHEILDDQGETIRYKKIRFIPDRRGQRSHTVTQGERLDLVAHRYFRDPEFFWAICDVNFAMWPGDVVAETGRVILIPPSER